MPEAGDFPTLNAVFGEHRRQHEIENIRLRRPEAARCRDDWNIVFVAQQHQIARFNRGQKALDMGAETYHGAADDVFRTGRRSSRSDQNTGGLGAQQVLQRTNHLLFVLNRRKRVAQFSAVTLNPRAHDVFKERASAVAMDRIFSADPGRDFSTGR